MKLYSKILNTILLLYCLVILYFILKVSTKNQYLGSFAYYFLTFYFICFYSVLIVAQIIYGIIYKQKFSNLKGFQMVKISLVTIILLGLISLVVLKFKQKKVIEISKKESFAKFKILTNIKDKEELFDSDFIDFKKDKFLLATANDLLNSSHYWTDYKKIGDTLIFHLKEDVFQFDSAIIEHDTLKFLGNNELKGILIH